MPDYVITLTDTQAKVLKEIAEKQNKTVQQILDEQALFRVKEQIDVWCEEYLNDVSDLTVPQQVELNAHLVACKQAYLKNLKRKKEENDGSI